MKKHFFIFILLSSFYSLFAQVSINDNGAVPDASAMLDISATDKGLLIPRMDSTDMANIPSPAEGLLVYARDKARFYYYDGSEWVLASGDNLGNHKATENLQMQNHWISNNGDDKGIYVNDNGDVGIGTNVIDGRLHVLMDSTTKNNIFERNEDARRGAGFRFFRSRGTFNAKAALNNNDVIASFASWAYTGTKYMPVAKISYIVDGSVSDDAVPSRIAFYTRDVDGNGYRTPRLIIKNDGKIGINTRTPQRTFHLNGTMRIEPTDTVPSNPSTGDMYMDDGTNTSDGNPKLRVYDGSSWHELW